MGEGRFGVQEKICEYKIEVMLKWRNVWNGLREMDKEGDMGGGLLLKSCAVSVPFALHQRFAEVQRMTFAKFAGEICPTLILGCVKWVGGA